MRHTLCHRPNAYHMDRHIRLQCLIRNQDSSLSKTRKTMKKLLKQRAEHEQPLSDIPIIAASVLNIIAQPEKRACTQLPVLVHHVESDDEFREFFRSWRKSKTWSFCFHTDETTNKTVVGIAVCFQTDLAIVHFVALDVQDQQQRIDAIFQVYFCGCRLKATTSKCVLYVHRFSLHTTVKTEQHGRSLIHCVNN